MKAKAPLSLLIVAASLGHVVAEDLTSQNRRRHDDSPTSVAFAPYFFDDFEAYDGSPLPRDRWESYEMYLFIDSKPVDAGGKGRCRVWRDETLIFDRTDVPTISTADGVIDCLYLFTYWNNEKPPTNHVFIDDLVIATSASPPPGKDEAGNKTIGNWVSE